MLAGLLLLLVIVELAVSVWCLTRFGGVLKELHMCEKQCETLAGMIRNWVPDSSGPVSVELPQVDDSSLSSANDVLANATDEQVAAAAEVLKRLGLSQDK